MGKRNVNQEITLKSREPGKEIQKISEKIT